MQLPDTIQQSPQELLSALHKRLAREITQSQLNSVCYTWTMDYLDEYSFKPYPTKPQKLVEFDTLHFMKQQTLNIITKETIRHLRYAYNEQYAQIENHNKVSLWWLGRMERYFNKNNLQVAVSKVKEIIREIEEKI